MPDMDGFSMAERIESDPALAGTLLMMLTSGAQQGDAGRCRALGIAGYLMKPVSQAEPPGSDPRGAGRTVRRAGSSARARARHTLRENLRQLRILLAEDNPVNQLVAVAAAREARPHGRRRRDRDGRAGRPGRAGPGGFDLMLMDVQMPEMDGLEATGLIRAREKSSGTHLPIVAMTAHAMKGDEERCLAAGMDGYISKPIQVEQLFATIDRVLQ